MTQQTLTPALAREGVNRIIAVDRKLAKVVAARGAPDFPEKPEPPFHTLTVSVVNQLLSKKAAQTIEDRLAEMMPRPFAPAAALKLTEAKMRAAGLSAAKARCLRELARRFEKGEVRPRRFPRMDDEEVISQLTAVPGVGRWTAEMYLMFQLRRPDVISLGDAGLLRAARSIYGKKFAGGDEELLETVAEKWRPYRTVGCRLLWRSLG